MSSKTKLISVILTIIIISLIALIINASYFNKRKYYIQGEVVSNNVDISTRVQGRAAEIFFDVGDDVKKGDILAILSSPALEAQKQYVESQVAIAKASKKVTYSTRPETIRAQKAAVDKATADLVLAQKSYDRLEKLSEQQSISRQQLDEAKNKLDSALKAKDAAQANYQLTVNGSSKETKSLADAQLIQSLAALNQIDVDLSELTVKAPIDGQITSKIAEIGQLYNPGTPLFTIVNLNDLWLTFYIREDLLHNAKVGDHYFVDVPALDKKIEVSITAINALGQFATWKATKATGDFDLRTFEVRVKPIVAVDGLRPGMSATAIWTSK